MSKNARYTEKENISDINHNERWWQVSSCTFFVVGFLILCNIGCFVNSGITDSLFMMFDVRLWQWWYCLFLGVIVAFSVKWYFVFSQLDGYDKTESNTATRLLRLTIAATVILILWVLLHATRTLDYFY